LPDRGAERDAIDITRPERRDDEIRVAISRAFQSSGSINGLYAKMCNQGQATPFARIAYEKDRRGSRRGTHN